MQRAKRAFRKGFKFYFIYVFIFAIAMFAVQKPRKKEQTDINQIGYENIEGVNKDRVALIESGKDGALVRINLIENARESIDISYYSLSEGMYTRILLGSILDAADSGIEVRILLDGLFHNLKGNIKDVIYGFESHPNIELKFYESFSILAPWAWNNRLHDKIIMVDENLALIGGRNIGDKYFVEDIERDSFVKDRDVIIFKEDEIEKQDSVIWHMQNYYDKIWNYEHSSSLKKKMKSKQKVAGDKFNQNLRNTYIEFKEDFSEGRDEVDWYEKTMETESVKFVHNPIARANQDPWCLRELLELASHAEKSIFIQSPYIIPTRNMKSKFEDYDIDLEKASLLTNSLASSPNPMAIAGYYNNRKQIVDSGALIYEFQGPESLHSKTYIFDDKISVIGSFNLDARSSYINSESMVVISSEKFSKKLKEEVELDLNNSLVVDSDYSYIEDSNIEENIVSVYKKVFITFLSKIALFLDYLL